jgi:hypothetical protein
LFWGGPLKAPKASKEKSLHKINSLIYLTLIIKATNSITLKKKKIAFGKKEFFCLLTF